MALTFTQLFLTNAAAPYTPATLRGAWDDTAGAVTKALYAERINGGAVTFLSRAESNASPTYDVLLYRGISAKLAAQTISGTVDLVTGIQESSADADFYWHVHLYVTQGDSDTPRGDLLTDYLENTTNEWPVAATNKALQGPATLASLAISNGDRLVVELGYIARNALTASRTAFFGYGTLDATSGLPAPDRVVGGTTAGASFLTFSSAITESEVPGRVSQFAVELTEANPAAATRLSQVGVEIAGQDPAPKVRVSQFGVEVLTDTALAATRVSQFALEVAAQDMVAARVTQLAIEIVRENREPFRNATLLIGLTWVIVTLRDGVTKYVWSDRPLPDPSTYYLGWKEPRVVKWGRIRRALSSVLDGQYETTDFRLTLDDNDHLVRNLRDELLNATMAVYMISDEGRRALLKPTTVYRGVIREAKPTGTLLYDLTIKDPFSEAFSSGAEAFTNG